MTWYPRHTLNVPTCCPCLCGLAEGKATFSADCPSRPSRAALGEGAAWAPAAGPAAVALPHTSAAAAAVAAAGGRRTDPVQGPWGSRSRCLQSRRGGGKARKSQTYARYRSSHNEAAWQTVEGMSWPSCCMFKQGRWRGVVMQKKGRRRTCRRMALSPLREGSVSDDVTMFETLSRPRCSKIVCIYSLKNSPYTKEDKRQPGTMRTQSRHAQDTPSSC